LKLGQRKTQIGPFLLMSLGLGADRLVAGLAEDPDRGRERVVLPCVVRPLLDELVYLRGGSLGLCRSPGLGGGKGRSCQANAAVEASAIANFSSLFSFSWTRRATVRR
jgi:hypothetical protein